MTDVSFHRVSFTELEQACLALYKQLKGKKFSRIVSISRGGLVVGRILSDLLDVPISHIAVSSYKGVTKLENPVVTEDIQTDMARLDVLLVDEVSDTGRTFEVVVKHLMQKGAKSITTASPYIKPTTMHIPNYFTQKVDAWIVFPYELRETYEALVEKLGSKENALAKVRELGFTEEEIEVIK